MQVSTSNERRPPGGGDPPSIDQVYDDLRPLLFSIAYRMLSSVGEAEDVVQESFIRYDRAVRDGERIESPKAWLSAVVTRLAIDQLRSARLRREQYVGQWLPEPIVDDVRTEDPAVIAEQADTISMSFLLLLERLSPVERAVFLLHDVFDYDFEEIGRIVGRSPAACRQSAVRARRRVRADRPRFEASAAEGDELAGRFFAAADGGDLDGLIEVLAEDVIVYGDGGGKVPQWSAPIVGVDRVARLFAGGAGQMHEVGVRYELAHVNAGPGGLLRAPDGGVVGVMSFEVGDGRIRVIRSVVNPEKIDHVGPVRDLGSVLRHRRRATRSAAAARDE